MSGVIQQSLPINLPRIVEPRPIFRVTEAYKFLPAITVRFDRPVMPTAKQIFQRVRPGIAQLPAVAKIAPSHLPTNVMIELLSKPKLLNLPHVIPPRMLSVVRDQRPCDL